MSIRVNELADSLAERFGKGRCIIPDYSLIHRTDVRVATSDMILCSTRSVIVRESVMRRTRCVVRHSATDRQQLTRWMVVKKFTNAHEGVFLHCAE